MQFFCLSMIWLVAAAGPVWSHEFWIEPEQYQVENDSTVAAHLRNGEEFKGISLAWFENRFTRFEIVEGENVRAVEGRMGDSPALNTTTEGSGLMIILHETTPSNVTYRDWDKFLKFVEHKDFANAVQVHETEGWSKELFRESYTRHAKALVSVGEGEGSDRAFGLETEFVALTNPYASDFDGTMAVRLLYNGMPRPNAQVEVFEKEGDSEAAITLYRTDAAGEARIPVKKGHAYLFDAVVLRPAVQDDDKENAPVWETLWAALTFEVPEE